MDILIFVILGGVVEWDFSRLLISIDNLCEQEEINSDEIIAQIGYTKYKPKNYKYFKFVDKKEFETYIDKAEIIITHGGAGTLIQSLKKKKKIISFPRLGSKKEHLDDHQIEMSRKLEQLGYLKLATNEYELREALKGFKTFMPKTFVCDNTKMQSLILDYIEHKL